jgi:hypothetical protein
MSTKKISRSVSESGHSNKIYRKLNQRSYRAAERQYLHKVKHDIDNYYDYDIETQREDYNYHGYKISPVHRWLSKQSGKVWNDVYSEIIKKFDNVVIGGRSIKDYIKYIVDVTFDPHDIKYGTGQIYTSFRRNEFFVDDNGILRNKTYIKRSHKYKIPTFDTQQIAKWLNGKVVGKVGNKLFWFKPADTCKKYPGGDTRQWITDWTDKYYSYGLRWLYSDKTPVYSKEKNESGSNDIIGYDKTWKVSFAHSFKQDRKLNKEELKYWNLIPEYYKTKVLERSPTYPNPPKLDTENMVCPNI